MKPKDWVGLIEAGYSLEGDDDAWLRNLLDHAATLSDRGFWPTIGTYSYTPTNIRLERIGTLGPATAAKFLQSSIQVKTHAVERFFRGGVPVCSLSEALYTQEPDLQEVVRQITDGVVQDKLAIKSLTGQNSALILCWLFSEAIIPTCLERKRWGLMASHLGAGLRLRSLGRALMLDSLPVEAIFDGNGTLTEARDEAKESSIRERLRKMVRWLDRARTKKGRKNPDAVMENWKGLVQGRWSIVDYFDTDQRRFVVAIKNDPNFPDPRGLTLRERQVAEFIGLGHTNKEISYTLGISPSAVTNCTVRARHKLGLSSIAELAAFFAPSGLRTKLAECAVEGDHLLVGAYPLIDEDCVKDLTEAERAVLLHLLAGSTNRDIGERRHTSEHTVANQVQAIFRKLEVGSRSGLASRLQCKV